MRRSPVHISFPFVLGLSLALVLLWLLGGGLPAAQSAGPHYVAPGAACGGPSPCYATVQAAVDAAVTGDIIKVAAGTYTGVLSRALPLGYPNPPASLLITQVVYISKSVIIQGGYITTNWTTPDPINNPTLIDAQGQGRVLVIAGNITPTLTGLRLTNGSATGLGGGPTPMPDGGGGVYIITARGTISNCQVFSNTADRGGGFYLDSSPATLNGNAVLSNTINRSGGGLYLFKSAATLNGNTVRANTADYYGGGLYLYRSPATFNGNSIISNTADAADAAGGGLYLSESDATLINNIIADNRVVSAGSGVAVEGASPRLLHTTIARNTGGDGSGVYITVTIQVGNFTVAMTNTILVSQTVGVRVMTATATLESTLWNGNTTNSIGNVISGTHNYTGDPAFVNPNAGNYHIGAGSAAIDRGVNAGVATDLDGIARPQGSAPDLGAYELPWYTLTVAATGTGSGVLTPTVGTHSYASGTTAWLTATANTGSSFGGWSGAVNGAASPISVTMDANKTVTATFTLNTYTLTVAATGTGSGVLTPTVGTYSYDYGTTAWLTATANTGSSFAGWSGAVNGPTNPISVTMDADKTVTATFNLLSASYTLTITYVGNGHGSVTTNPSGSSFVAGTVVTLTAVPSATSSFAGWSGEGLSGLTNPITLTMDADKTVTAGFSTYMIYLPVVMRNS